MWAVEEDFVIPETTNPHHLPVFDDDGRAVGYVDLDPVLREIQDTKEYDHLRQDILQLRNQVIRLQTQMRQLETRRGR